MSPYSEVHEEQKGTRVRCALMTQKCSVFLHTGKKFLNRETDNLRVGAAWEVKQKFPYWWESTKNLQQFLHTRVMETGSRAKHLLPLHYRGSEICNTLLQRWNVGSPEHLNFVLVSSAFFLDWVYNGPDINILWVIKFWGWWWGEAHHHHGRRNQAVCLLLLLLVMANFIPTNVFKLLLKAQQSWFH